MTNNKCLNDPKAIRTLNDHELSQVTAGAIPLAVAAYYSSGFLAGVYGGWTFGREFFS